MHEIIKVTVISKYQLPRIDDIFDQLRAITMFSKTGMRLDNHQVRVVEKDMSKTMN